MWFLGVNLTPKSTKDPPDRIFSFSPKSLLYTSTKCSKNKKNGCSGQFWEIGVQSWWIWPISSLLIKIFEIDQTYLPNSLQNPTQLIFGFMKKIVSPLLLPLQTIFAFKIACFYCISKNCRKLNFFLPISLQNPTQGIFCIMKKIVSPLLLPLRTIFSFKNAHSSVIVKMVGF